MWIASLGGFDLHFPNNWLMVLNLFLCATCWTDFCFLQNTADTSENIFKIAGVFVRAKTIALMQFSWLSLICYAPCSDILLKGSTYKQFHLALGCPWLSLSSTKHMETLKTFQNNAVVKIWLKQVFFLILWAAYCLE